MSPNPRSAKMTPCGRVRRWHTKDAIIDIVPDCHVLPRYLHGSDYATGRVNAMKQGGPRKKTSLPRIRLLKPPPGGWKGGS